MTVTVDLDTIRTLVGDTDTTTPILSDDQINLIVDGYTSPRLAAAAVALAIAGLYSRKVSFSLEGLSIKNSDKAAAYRELATQLRIEASNESGQFGFGVSGVSIAAVEAAEDNDDRMPSTFKKGMQQDPQIRQGGDDDDGLVPS